MFVAPTDALQGDVYRIIFYHVPFGVDGLSAVLLLNFVASVHYLPMRNPRRSAPQVDRDCGRRYCVIIPYIPQVRDWLQTIACIRARRRLRR